MTEEFQSQLSSPQSLMNQITETQADLVELRNRRGDLEQQLAGINAAIDDDVTALAELQEKLNAAISSATHKAVGG